MIFLIIKQTLRELLKFRRVYFITLSGLTLALTAFLLIVSYVLYETSFDTFIPEYENIYRIESKIETNGKLVYEGAKTPPGIYYCKDEIPEIESITSMYHEKCQIKYKDVCLFEQDILWAEDGLRDVFPLEMEVGQIKMTAPHVGIVSLSKANALFGNENPVGKIVKVNSGFKIEITGVFKDLPANTHLKADFFLSVATWLPNNWASKEWQTSWDGTDMWNYVRLSHNNIESIEDKLNKLSIIKNPDFEQKNTRMTFSLTRCDQVHFATDLKSDYGPKTKFSNILVLIVISIFILIISWINHTNLSAALCIQQFKTSKLQNILGAGKLFVFVLSFCKNIVINILSALLAYSIYIISFNKISVYLDMSSIQQYIDKQMLFSYYFLAVIVSIIISSLSVLFTTNQINQYNSNIKQRILGIPLIIAQLILTSIFTFTSIMVYKQLNYMQNVNLGMNLNKVVVLSAPTSFNGEANYQDIDYPKINRFRIFRQKLQENPSFLYGTATYSPIGVEVGDNNAHFTRADQRIDETISFHQYIADNEFIKTFDFNLLAGKEFPDHLNSYRQFVIINQLACKMLNFKTPQEAIDKEIREGDLSYRIIGVINDYHHEGLHKHIAPMIFKFDHPSEFGYYSFKLKTNEIALSIDYLKKIWTKTYPTDPFNFFFLDEYYNQQYKSEVRLSKFYLIFALISIFISCLGLYGIIEYYISRKTKEVGIRKVNGAKSVQVVFFLLKDVLVWLGLSSVITIPINYFITSQWLENYAYKTSINWWIFALTIFSITTIVLFTVTLQTWRAATRNPIESLRYE